ncbi:Mitochondrial carnitine/acylcarnitine carrier-like protein, partial [Cucurbita argyrosperma subsp. sororia]
MGDVAKDLAAGTAGGAAQLICGHPFDTIKVKLQSQPAPLSGQLPKYSGAMDAVRQTLASEGSRGLYKVKQQVVCGAGAGAAVSLLACPTELIKCRLQAQSALAASSSVGVAVKYGGPMDVAKHVVQSNGVKGLFKGLAPTMAREVPGNAVVFGVYEMIKQHFAGGRDTSNLGREVLILAGGVSGAAFWLAVYPTDVIKSVIQVDDFKNPKFSGSIDAFRKIMASEGVKGLYKGFGPAIVRSAPANAACFLVYEITRSSFG